MTRILVVGGTQLLGAQVIAKFRQRGHAAIAADEYGVSTTIGGGLQEALAGIEVVVDAASRPLHDDPAAWDLLTASTINLLTAEEQAGVCHHVALSLVGASKLNTSRYFQAKRLQELLIQEADVAHSIVRATPIYENFGAIADSATYGDTIRLPPTLTRPIAAADVAAAVAHLALGEPVNGIREVAGPELYALDDLVRVGLRARRDTRRVLTEVQARYLGAQLDQHSLLPPPTAIHYPTRFTDWLYHSPTLEELTF